MTRTRLLSTAALAAALFAAPAALAQRGGAGGGDVPSMASGSAQNRATADVDRLHKGNGTNGGPAELLRMAQTALRRGQTVQANELLERAETRLLLRDGVAATADPTRPVGGEPARHVSEARRALGSRDRAEAVRHTNLAIAATRDADSGAGSDAGQRGAQGGGLSGQVDSGMGTLPAGGGGRAVVRDGGSGGSSVSRAEGIVLAQTGGGAGGGRGATTTLPPGDTLPGWSGPRGGVAPGGSGATAAPPPFGASQGQIADPALGGNARGGGMLTGPPNLTAPSSSSMTGGEPARAGGAPPGDTSRAPGSTGLGGAGVGNSAVGGPIR